MLLLGRVMSGRGGDTVLDTCKAVLADEYPALAAKIVPTLPDERFRPRGPVRRRSLAALHAAPVIRRAAH